MAGNLLAELRHEQAEVQIILVGTKLYYSPTVPILSWTELHRCGRAAPEETQSVIRQYGENMAMPFNSGGVFKIDLQLGIFWKANSEIPATVITSVEKTETKTYGRRQTYSMSKLKGNGQNSQRYDAGVEIIHETGTCNLDASGKDYGTVYTARPVGDGSTSRGFLSGAVLTAGYDVIGGWAAVSVFQFGFTMNGTTKNCVGDASMCLSMDQLAEKIQLAIRDHFPTVTCAFKGTYFDFETNLEGSTVGVITAGEGALDIGTDIIGPGTPALTATYNAPVEIGELRVPIDLATGLPDTHFNRFSLYSSLDVGVEGMNPLTRDVNNPELFIHNSDIPVAKALIAKVVGNVVTINAAARAGEFVPGDSGSVLRFQNGSSVTLTIYLTSKTFQCNISTTVAEQACAIGGGVVAADFIRVTTVTASAGNVRRVNTAGTPFTAADKGKILFLSNGDEITLKEYIDADNFSYVEQDVTASNVAACLDPKVRRWTDTLRDDPYEDQPSLRSRVTLRSLQQRLFIPLPNCNRGDVSGSMIWAAESGTSMVRYSQAKSMWRHLGGYYYESEQTEEADDNIDDVSIIGSIVTVKCRRKTYKISTNQFESIVLKNEATAITKCSGISILDGAVGPGIRILTESGYGENLATNRIQKYLDKMIPSYATRYDPVNGFTFWGWIVKLL
jgi:hypothetical protein